MPENENTLAHLEQLTPLERAVADCPTQIIASPAAKNITSAGGAQ